MESFVNMPRNLISKACSSFITDGIEAEGNYIVVIQEVKILCHFYCLKRSGDYFIYTPCTKKDVMIKNLTSLKEMFIKFSKSSLKFCTFIFNPMKMIDLFFLIYFFIFIYSCQSFTSSHQLVEAV